MRRSSSCMTPRKGARSPWLMFLWSTLQRPLRDCSGAKIFLWSLIKCDQVWTTQHHNKSSDSHADDRTDEKGKLGVIEANTRIILSAKAIRKPARMARVGYKKHNVTCKKRGDRI